jgi:hypothetical protein
VLGRPRQVRDPLAAGRTVRGISRQVLASEAAYAVPSGACKDELRLWNRQEALHEGAANQAGAAIAAAPLLDLCSTCGSRGACYRWAEAEKYTGIAGGAAWVNGVTKPVHWVRRQADRRLAG